MDLRNGQITAGELLSNPKVRMIMQQRFPWVLNHPMLQSVYPMSLNQAVDMAKQYVPPAVINQVLNMLKEI